MPRELTNIQLETPDGAAVELEEYGETVHQLLMEKYEPIAIVGVGLRFPGGSGSLDEFGQFLDAGQSGIGPIPQDRWDVAAFTPDAPDDRGKIRTTGGGFLDRIDLFDPMFFNISPKEAQYMDPQQRMLLETAWEALENANIDPTPLRRGNGGVYIGASSIDYALELDALPYDELDGLLASGITMFPLSGRLSYFLGWRGPSASIDTACSSSLTALHMAVQGLRRGECDIALCGGVNALHHPRIPVMFSHAQMLAPDGICKTFDDSADGYVRAEGCGVIVLKRLSTAQRDGDAILAIVRGTAVGQDGDSAGLTVPNGAAQEIVIRKAIAAARLTPADIQYVEAHGTGTPLGDPIELGAINDVFAESHDKDQPLLVGSVKTNVGHMEPASGLVGLIKVVSQLNSKTIYPHLNLTKPSGRIPWDIYPIEVPTERRSWDAPVRRAVVNSFGFAGTIAAVVLEQASDAAVPELLHADASERRSVLTLSAKSAAALTEQVSRYRDYLEQHPEVDVHDLCHSANVGRAHFKHRVAAVVSDRAGLAKSLERAAAAPPRGESAAIRKVGFLFGGQGTQYAGMGAQLYRQHPVFARWVDEVDRLFAALLKCSVRDLLLGDSADPGLIDQTMYTQPVLFTLEYALARLWMSWGVQPGVLIGHSIGEVVAATVAGLFSLSDAVSLVAARGRLMQSVGTSGGMAVIGTPAEDVSPLLRDHPDLALAAINAPDQCVISGGTHTLATVSAILLERGVKVQKLSVSHAFHSPLMAEVFDDFRAAITGITFTEPTIPVISNVTGKAAKRGEMADPEYWVQHIGQPVLFMDGIRAAVRRGRYAFVEIGASTALTALASKCLDPADEHLWFASLRRRDTTGDTITRSLADMYVAGVVIRWQGVHAERHPARVGLPTYPFQRKRYWLPIKGAGKAALGVVAGGRLDHPLLGSEIEVDGAPVGTHEFAVACTAAEPGYLADHVISGSVIMPISGFVEAMLAAQDATWGETARMITDLELREPLVLGEAATELRTRLVPRVDTHGDVVFDVEVASLVEGERTRHATATLCADPAPLTPGDHLWRLLHAAGPVVETLRGDDLYLDLSSVERSYGPSFQRLQQVQCHAKGVLTGDVACRSASAVEHLPPEVLESALQALAFIDNDGVVFSPVGVGTVRMFKKPRGERLQLLAEVRVDPDAGPDRRIADLLLLEDKLPVAELRGVALARATEQSQRQHFVHRLAWTADETSQPPMSKARHVVVVNDQSEDRWLTEPTARLTVSTAVGPAELKTALDDLSVTDVCWLWQRGAGAVSAESLRVECEANYRALQATVAVLNASPPSRALRLWLVTEGAQQLPGDQVNGGQGLAASSLWGFGHVLLSEYPRYRASLVDLAPGDVAGLIAEWGSENVDEYQVAYRGERRHVRRVLPEPESIVHSAPTLRRDRTYLVTGGLGGLGLVTAKKLVELGARHVALVSRRNQPKPEVRELLAELSERASVRLLSADLGSAEDVTRLFAELNAAEYPLGGIVHAAGEIGKSLIGALSWEAIDEQLQPKMYGGWLLHEASRDIADLEFFVVYSSIAGVIGGVTQAHYAAASTFLDSLAIWRAEQGLPGLATNWGAWGSVGMSARLDDSLSRQVELGGIRFFSPTRGLRALEQLLTRQSGQRIVGEYDWDLIAAGTPNKEALYAEVARALKADVAAVDIAALTGKPKEERLAEITALVRAKVAAALQFDDELSIDTTSELVSLGLDSLMAMEVKRSLESLFGLILPASLAYDYPSVSQLTAFVDGQLPAAVDN